MLLDGLSTVEWGTTRSKVCVRIFAVYSGWRFR
jgi:hypothetical protein